MSSAVPLDQPDTSNELSEDRGGWAEALLLALFDAREMLLAASRHPAAGKPAAEHGPG